MKKRLFSLFLMAGLVLGQIPQAALAEETEAYDIEVFDEVSETPVAETVPGQSAAAEEITLDQQDTAGIKAAQEPAVENAVEAAADESANDRISGESFPGGTAEDMPAEESETDTGTSVEEAEIPPVQESGTEAVSEASASFFGVLISDADGNLNTGGSYWLDYSGLDGEPSRTGSSNHFAEDGTNVYIEAYPADGYKFVGWYQGEPDPADGGRHFLGDPLTTDRVYQFEAPISLSRPYICAVFDVDTAHQGDQVQMWVGNTKIIGPDSKAQGGRVAVSYTPGWDDYPDVIKAKDGSDFVYGEVLQFYKGDECTVYAQADEGFRFVGWYHANIEWGPGDSLAYEGSVISTDTSFTYKPGETVVAGDSEPLRYVCAVFEKAGDTDCTVTFDPGTGTGSMDAVKVDKGSGYTLPACSFTHTNTERVFYKWSVDGELMNPGDTITVDKDAEVIAKWMYTKEKRIDNSVDRSTTEVKAQLILTDTLTGDKKNVVPFDEVTASAFTEPSNVTVKAMIEEAKEASKQKAQEYAGKNTVTTVSETVSGPEIEDTKNDRTYTYFDNGIDEAGDYYQYLVIDGEFLHQWLYTVAITAEYTSHAHTLVPTAEVPATCTEPGTKAYWTCSECGMLFSDAEGTESIAEPVVLPALGHDWSDWVVVKEPTTTEPGLETRTCKNDPTHTESREISVITISYRDVSGDGSSFTKGSSKDLAFVFKRSYEDSEAFSHFTGIEVDGYVADSSDYTAESGSVIVTLAAAYLETLSVGEHTLTALFDDGNDVTVSFTVKKAEEQKKPASDEKKKDSGKKDDSGKTGQKTAARTPATGDSSHAGFFAGILAVSILSMLFAFVLQRKRRYR